MGIAKFPQPAAAAIASLTAGPIFVIVAPLVDLYWRLPAPIEVDVLAIPAFLPMMPLIMLVGAFFSFAPNLVGTIYMAQLSRRNWVARTPPAWMAVGAAFGGGLAFMLLGGIPGSSIMAPAFALTGALCAGICRLLVDLDPAGET
jgi:hypothetical protein